MLSSQMNAIVKSGELQKGSIVQLHQFTGNVIQGRRIIIIMHLEVLVSESPVVGAPQIYNPASATSQGRAPVPVQSPVMDQSAVAAGNTHSSGTILGQNTTGEAYLNPKIDTVSNNPSYGGSYTRNMNNVNSLALIAEQGAVSFADTHPSGNQNQRFSNPTAGGGYHPPVNTYGRPGPPSYQHPPPVYSNRGSIAKNEAPARIIPIAALNPYQGRWTIKARVTAKSEMRRYNNTRGEGKVFSFDLLDSEGGEIRVTCFNTVADQFYDYINVGKVYLISKGTLKPAQKSFNHLNSEYEIFLESTSTIQPWLEEDNTIPKQQFNFRPISEIEGMENKSTADVIGIVTAVNIGSIIMKKDGKEAFKRTLHLMDMSGRSVELTLYLLKYEEQNDEKFAETIRNVLFNQYLFKLKVKEETFNDEQRVKSTVVKAEKVNPSSESRYLLGLIEKPSVDNPNMASVMHGVFVSGSGMPSSGYGNMESKPFAHPVTSNFGSNNGAECYRNSPVNQVLHRMNDYGGTMNHSYSRVTQPFCNNCGSAGHNFQNCPRAMSRQGQPVGGGFANRSSSATMDGGGAPNMCFKCQQPGHWARDCPGVNAGPAAYGGCGMSGRYSNQHAGSY